MSFQKSRSMNELIRTFKRLGDRGTNIYKSLDPASKEIRILEVAPGQESDAVECTLKHISLLLAPPNPDSDSSSALSSYETISYCWGPPRKPRVIRVNGHWTSVPPSAEAAVRRMRHRDRERVLWIDAICIDQSSLLERSQQVAMMSDIYRMAKGNLVYLGEDDARIAASAAETAHVLAAEMRLRTDNFTQVWQTVYDAHTGAHLHSTEGFESPLDVDALEVLFNLPWFRRLWVLQEVALAPCNTCHWGETTFDLLDVTRAARWIAFKRDFMSYAIMETRGWNCASMMFELSDASISSLLEPSYLGDLMNTLQLCEKTEPRDGIYGLLGLLSDKHTLPEDWLWLLEVDYSKTVADVMCDATRYALAECRDMRAIQLSFFPDPSPESTEGFPSWAVRADLQPEPQALLRLPHFHAADRGLDAPSLLGDMKQGYGILLGQGFIVDRVHEITAIGYDDRLLESLYSWLLSVKGMAMEFCKDVYGEDEMQICTAIAFSLTAGRNKGGSRAQVEDITTLIEFLESLGTLPTNSEDRERMYHAVNEGTWRALNDIAHPLYCVNRRFFVTDTGYMGIGPSSMQSGDFVVILRGGRLPFVLRRLLRYHHVGSAYVHGIMNGEAVTKWQSRNEPEVTFSIA